MQHPKQCVIFLIWALHVSLVEAARTYMFKVALGSECLRNKQDVGMFCQPKNFPCQQWYEIKLHVKEKKHHIKCIMLGSLLVLPLSIAWLSHLCDQKLYSVFIDPTPFYSLHAIHQIYGKSVSIIQEILTTPLLILQSLCQGAGGAFVLPLPLPEIGFPYH